MPFCEVSECCDGNGFDESEGGVARAGPGYMVREYSAPR